MADLRDVALVIGTATASIGTIWGIAQSVSSTRRHESIRLKLDVREKQHIINALPQYDPEALYTSVRVINLSKRPVKIASAGAQLLHVAGGFILGESVHESRIVQPDDVTDFLGKEDETSKHKVAYYYAATVTGKTFKKYMTPRLLVWGRNLLHKTHLWRKRPLNREHTEAEQS